jgi:hypothetical protein
VFQKVYSDTRIPVTLLLDIDVTTRNASFSLTRELKAMVCDAEIMQCVFAASEGLLFQDQARREPRLQLFYSKELSISASVVYLKKFAKMKEHIEISDLSSFPRIFRNLDDYAASQDKKAFIESFLKTNIEFLKELALSQRKFLKVALTKEDVGVDEYEGFQLKKTDLIELAKKNVLIVNHNRRFEIQFDCWREAIQMIP